MRACTAPQLFRHRKTHQFRIAPCRQWRCPSCAQRLAWLWCKVLTWAALHGRPPAHFLTLTLKEPLPLWKQAPPAEREAQRQAAIALTKLLTTALTRLVAEIRQTYGAFEYIAFVELTTGQRTPGHRPHLHLLARGVWVPEKWLSRRWAFHTRGSWRVDVQHLRSPDRAASYMTGYTVGHGKKAQQQPLLHWPGPRIRYSRRYFPGPVPEIRKEIAAAAVDAPAEPDSTAGGWEWLGSATAHWYWRWHVAKLAPKSAAARPESGIAPTSLHKEPRNGNANPPPSQGTRAGPDLATRIFAPQSGWISHKLLARPCPALWRAVLRGGESHGEDRPVNARLRRRRRA